MKKFVLPFSFISLFIGLQSMASSYHCTISKKLPDGSIYESVQKDVDLIYNVNFNIGRIYSVDSGSYTLEEYRAFEPRTVYISREVSGMEKIAAQSNGNYVSLSDSKVLIECKQRDK